MNTSTMAVIAASVLAGAWLFFAFISGVGKTFKDTNAPHTNSAAARSKQEENIQEIQRRHRQAMEDMKQKIADGQHRY